MPVQGVILDANQSGECTRKSNTDEMLSIDDSKQLLVSLLSLQPQRQKPLRMVAPAEEASAIAKIGALPSYTLPHFSLSFHTINDVPQ